MEQQLDLFELADRESIFIGKEKQRLRSIQLTLESVVNLGEFAFGYAYAHRFSDLWGNVFVWISGTRPALTTGKSYLVDATVKTHRTFARERQTVITRTKIL